MIDTQAKLASTLFGSTKVVHTEDLSSVITTAYLRAFLCLTKGEIETDTKDAKEKGR